jgi:hypothetical protein
MLLLLLVGVLFVGLNWLLATRLRLRGGPTGS